MPRQTTKVFYGSAAMAALLLTTSQSFAVEPGDFQATLRGVTIGVPLGAAPPPGFYSSIESFTGPNGVGVGQNGAAEGANAGRGLTVFGQAESLSLVWSTGYNIFGGSLVLAAIQPFFTVAGLGTQPTAGVPTVGTPPMDFTTASFFENWHNTVWASAVSWNWHNGWFSSLGLNIQGPDGSQYNGTLNQDYWTVSPTAAIAYLSKEWKIAINADYDIHSASAGHTGTYAALAALTGVAAFAAPGVGYTTGNQLFIDWSAEYKWGKFSAGPAGYFKFQTTADTPGSGFTCASLAANPMFGPSLSCGRAEDIALGAIASYDFGPAELQTWVTDSVYTRDDFAGWSVFSRLSFKLEGFGAPPSPPIPTKAAAQ
jgi:hypothetical protein